MEVVDSDRIVRWEAKHLAGEVQATNLVLRRERLRVSQVRGGRYLSTAITALVGFVGFVFWGLVGLLAGVALDSAVLTAALSGFAPLTFAVSYVFYIWRKRRPKER